MNKPLLGRRQFLRNSMQSFAGAGIAAGVLYPLDYLFPARGAAADLSPGTIYRATGFYERAGLERKKLVALVLVPLNGTAPPIIEGGTGLEKRDLGSASLETFQGQIGGMQQKVLFEHGALRAVVYSVKTIEGDYAEEKRYLIGRIGLDIDNPRERAARTEGHGSGGSGGESSGSGM